MIVKSRLIRLSLNRRYSTALKWPLKDVKFSESSKVIEKHWQKRLFEDFERVKISNQSNEKKYILSMFPYPSGRLHIGHMRVYTISDATSRYYRLNGYNVIHPIGWDSFGLPAENAARDKGVDAREWTLKNIEAMKEQLMKTRILFDWEREISTCEPEYFRWTQWLFCRLFEKGLVKRCTAQVNWDPVDKTVLAAEQIDSEGRSWRSGAVAEKRKLRQWMVETPKYAKRLQDGLKKIAEQWGEVADIQSNWIGKCDVFRFMLPVRNEQGEKIDETIDLRIKDVHNISNANFIILNRSHSLVDQSLSESGEVLMPFEALNVVNGRWMKVVVVDDDYNQKMGMSSHLGCRLGDERIDEGIMKQFSIEKQNRKLDLNLNDIQEIASFGGYGGYETSRTLTDWVVSRQRAWGTPIPMIIADDGRAAPMDDSKLPVLAMDRGRRVESVTLNGSGVIDSDTLDTFFDSAWYYLRFLDNKNESSIASKEAMKQMPVDVYVGGIEHAAVHMFFARFIAHFLSDIGVCPTNEPFRDLIPQGIVRGRTFIEASSGRYLLPNDVKQNEKGEMVLKENENEPVSLVYEKMSKSKNNGVDLESILDSESVDMTRLRLLESAAPRAPINWGENDMKGTKKWLDRISTIVSNVAELKQSGERVEVDDKREEQLREVYNYFVRHVGMCLEVLHLHNTALMRLQGMTNAIRKMDSKYLASSPQGLRIIDSLVVMLQVFAPHLASELWHHLHPSRDGVMHQQWPVVDADADIDFLLMVDGVSCGRPTVDRRIVEEMTVDKLWARASSTEHRDFLEMLKTHGVAVSKPSMTSRSGFHVTLSVETISGNKDENRKVIGKILDIIQAKKREMDVKKKNKKNKKRVENS